MCVNFLCKLGDFFYCFSCVSFFVIKCINQIYFVSCSSPSFECQPHAHFFLATWAYSLNKYCHEEFNFMFSLIQLVCNDIVLALFRKNTCEQPDLTLPSVTATQKRRWNKENLFYTCEKWKCSMSALIFIEFDDLVLIHTHAVRVMLFN